MRTRDDARPCRQKVCTSPQPIPSNHPWLGCVIQIKAKKHADGGWAADIVVKGTHTGSAWTPMPGKLPPIELKEPPTSWTIGPEEFKVWCDPVTGKGVKLEIKCLKEGSLVGPPGIYVSLGGQLPAPPPEMAVLKAFCTGFQSKKTLEYAAPGCMFNPPGAPPMPIEAFMGMIDSMNAAWPDWDSRFLGAEKQENGTWKVKTQQSVGKMVADFKPGGPLPNLPLSKAPASWKSVGCTFPVEVGTYTMSEDGTKVLKATYDGTFDASYAGGSQETSPEVAAIWNKKGDQSDTGFGCMYQLAGIPMPPPPSAPSPDMLMGAHVVDFEDWFTGFKAHSTEKTFPMNGTTYTVPMARGDALDDSKTDVLCDIKDPNMIEIVLFGLDMAKFAPVMEDPQFKAMSEKAIKTQDPPLILSDAPTPGTPPPSEKMDLLFTYEVEDVEKWIEGFLAHGSSKTGTWGVEAKYTRAEFCDEAKTRVFKSAYNPKRVGGMIYGCDMAKMGEFMAHESFAKISEVLAVKPETMMMKTFASAPMP